MIDLFSGTLILAAAGLVAVAWEATGKRRNPLLTVAGVALAVMAVVIRIAGGGSFPTIASGVLGDVGMGMLLAGAVMLSRRGHARPFVVLGAGMLVAAVGFGWLSGQGDAAASDDHALPLLVELGPDDDISELQGMLDEFGATAERAFPSLSLEVDADLFQVFIVTLPAGTSRKTAEELSRLLTADSENVDFVEADRAVSLYPPVSTGDATSPAAGTRVSNDPLADAQWAIDAARIDGAHRLLAESKPVRKAVVAILDTGVDARHEDIRSTFAPSPASDDAHGHGTHCAGIAGAATNNGIGMASLNWNGEFVDVTSYRALSSSGMGTLESIAQAVIDATTDGADVISMSLGDYAPKAPRVIREAIAFALKRGVIVLAAAGNSSQNGRDHMPANVEGVIAVAATDASMRKASFSNTNSGLRRPIAAPGVDILSLVPNGRYDRKSGTSMATPLVAGLIGVMRSLQPELTAEEAYSILRDSGQEVQESDTIGRVIDAEQAISTVLGRSK